MTISIFILATAPAVVGSILCYDNILILIFIIISIAFVMIYQFSFRVSCHSACFIKIKMEKTTFDKVLVESLYLVIIALLLLYNCVIVLQIPRIK